MKITGEMMIIINLEINITMISMLVKSLDILIIKKKIISLKEINFATIMAQSIIKVVILNICLILITNQTSILVTFSHKASIILNIFNINVRYCQKDFIGFQQIRIVSIQQFLKIDIKIKRDGTTNTLLKDFNLIIKTISNKQIIYLNNVKIISITIYKVMNWV